mmetsp:Transcript_6835/g.16649  ORF Transcript_6835/g.16649 Transcript_6835/m.16649 type:complete len:139 (+) Transcript_6835:452-868(+)
MMCVAIDENKLNRSKKEKGCKPVQAQNQYLFSRKEQFERATIKMKMAVVPLLSFSFWNLHLYLLEGGLLCECGFFSRRTFFVLLRSIRFKINIPFFRFSFFSLDHTNNNNNNKNIIDRPNHRLQTPSNWTDPSSRDET